MSDRIILILDDTVEEARQIAAKLGDASASHDGINLTNGIEYALTVPDQPDKVRKVAIRSQASADVNGPPGIAGMTY